MNDYDVKEGLIKALDDLNNSLDKKQLQMLSNIWVIATGHYIFHRVLRRHFGDKAEVVRDFLVDNGYATQEIAYACPCCNHMIGISNSDFDDYLKEDTMFCYSCDREIVPKCLIKDWILVRTDKPWGDIDED